jgi:hypothetical protein
MKFVKLGLADPSNGGGKQQTIEPVAQTRLPQCSELIPLLQIAWLLLVVVVYDTQSLSFTVAFPWGLTRIAVAAFPF